MINQAGPYAASGFQEIINRTTIKADDGHFVAASKSVSCIILKVVAIAFAYLEALGCKALLFVMSPPCIQADQTCSHLTGQAQSALKIASYGLSTLQQTKEEEGEGKTENAKSISQAPETGDRRFTIQATSPFSRTLHSTCATVKNHPLIILLAIGAIAGIIFSRFDPNLPQTPTPTPTPRSLTLNVCVVIAAALLTCAGVAQYCTQRLNLCGSRNKRSEINLSQEEKNALLEMCKAHRDWTYSQIAENWNRLYLDKQLMVYEVKNFVGEIIAELPYKERPDLQIKKDMINVKSLAKEWGSCLTHFNSDFDAFIEGKNQNHPWQLNSRSVAKAVRKYNCSQENIERVPSLFSKNLPQFLPDYEMEKKIAFSISDQPKYDEIPQGKTGEIARIHNAQHPHLPITFEDAGAIISLKLSYYYNDPTRMRDFWQKHYCRKDLEEESERYGMISASRAYERGCGEDVKVLAMEFAAGIRHAHPLRGSSGYNDPLPNGRFTIPIQSRLPEGLKCMIFTDSPSLDALKWNRLNPQFPVAEQDVPILKTYMKTLIRRAE